MSSSDHFSSTSNLEPAYGAHPTIVTKVAIPVSIFSNVDQATAESTETDSNSTCTLSLHYTLSPLLFVDPYELGMRTEDYEVAGLSGRGARELEKPVHALPLADGLDERDEGVRLVLRRDVAPAGQVLEVRLPIHVRYAEPRPVAITEEGYVVQGIEEPVVVLTCADTRSLKCSTPSQKTLPPLLADSLPPSSSPCLAIISSSQPLDVSIPVGNTLHTPTVELGTAMTIVLCCLWVAREALKACKRIYGAKESGKHKTA